jgi:hypothetical protein
MQRWLAFVLGYVAAALVLGAAAGAFVGTYGRLEAAAEGAGWIAAGALVSLLAPAWRPCFDAPAWRLWLMVVLFNPAFLASLVFVRLGWHCDAAFSAACLLAPAAGLLWRGASRRAAAT